MLFGEHISNVIVDATQCGGFHTSDVKIAKRLACWIASTLKVVATDWFSQITHR